MTQHNIKQDLKIFGQVDAEDVLRELKQFHDRDVIEPKKASALTKEEKRGALQYLMFLKKKRCSRIKGWGCADGRKKRIYKSKEETSSPTVAVESLMLSCVIDAKERRQVVTADIPRAFMQTDMDEDLFTRLDGPLAQVLAKADPRKYKKFLKTEKGRPVIYVKLKRRYMVRCKRPYCFGRT